MAAPRAVPRLASDVFRGYMGLAAGILLTMPLSVIAALSPDPVNLPLLLASFYLTSWALVGFVTSGLTVLTFSRASGEQLADWLRATTPRTARSRFWYVFNGGGAASWAITGSFVAIAAVLVLSLDAVFHGQPLLVWGAVGVVAGSLLLTLTSYAVRYAREHSDNGGLAFPQTPSPTYADYFYLAVQVGTTLGSSDVTLESTRMRRLVTGNSLISFTFNTVIVALLVSLLVTTAS